jgi:hypothetical protein
MRKYLPATFVLLILGSVALLTWRNGIVEQSPTHHVIDSFDDEADAIALYDISGDGKIDVVAAESAGPGRALYWYKQQTPWDWIRYKVDGGSSMGQDIEGITIIEIRGVVYVFSLDQRQGKIRIYTPANPDKPGRSWAKFELITNRDFIQDAVPIDIDSDGEMELVYTWEGANAESGGIHWLDFNGTDPMNANEWTDHIMIQHPSAYWLARATLDLAGNGRGDIVFVARNRPDRNPGALPGVYWLEKPEDFTEQWIIHTIDDRVADWTKVDTGNFFGDGHGKDIVAIDLQGNMDIALYRFDSNYARMDIKSVSDQQYNVRTVPTANHCDNAGRNAFLVAHPHSFIYGYKWDSTIWVTFPLNLYPTQGHPLDDDIVWHDLDGDGNYEAFIADSSDTDPKLIWVKFTC